MATQRKKKRDLNRLPRFHKPDSRSLLAGILGHEISSSLGPISRTTDPSKTTPVSTTTTMPTAASANASADDSFRAEMSRLQETLHVLERVYHRNRNQHRTQHWWRALGLLKKHLRTWVELEVEVCELRRPKRKQARRSGRSMRHLRATTTKKKAEENTKARVGTLSGMMDNADEVRRRFERAAELEVRIKELKVWVRDVIVPKSYVAFSSVVADKQFAGLGLVLLGCAADVAGVVGLPEPKLQAGGDNENRVLHLAEAAAAVHTESVVQTGTKAGKRREEIYRRGADDGKEDMGELILRSQPKSQSIAEDTRPEATRRQQIPVTVGEEDDTTMISDHDDLSRPQTIDSRAEHEDGSGTREILISTTPSQTPGVSVESKSQRSWLATPRSSASSTLSMSSAGSRLGTLMDISSDEEVHHTRRDQCHRGTIPVATATAAATAKSTQEVSLRTDVDSTGTLWPETETISKTKPKPTTKKKKKNAIDELFANFG